MAAQFPAPTDMRRPDGSARYAYVTFLLFNLSNKYVASSLLMAYMLRKQRTQADLICMVTHEIPQDVHYALEMVFDHVIIIDPVYIPHKRRHQRPDRPFLFTRLAALRLGPDGDLGFNYDKVVILDADILPLRFYDHLFSLNTPAGIINEKREHFLEYDDHGRYIIPDSVAVDGTWKWHRIYGDICPHGQPIPKEITDRAAHDFTNLGLIGAMFIMDTSQAELDSILADVQRPEVARLVGDIFDLPDMQYLTVRYSGQWTNVDLRFCGHSGYPNLSVLFGNHYAGFKPWAFNKPKTLKRFMRYEDYQYWYHAYIEMVTKAYPRLLRLKRLQRLLANIHEFVGISRPQ
jgi:glycogenin glucosyltransferase